MTLLKPEWKAGFLCGWRNREMPWKIGLKTVEDLTDFPVWIKGVEISRTPTAFRTYQTQKSSVCRSVNFSCPGSPLSKTSRFSYNRHHFLNGFSSHRITGHRVGVNAHHNQTNAGASCNHLQIRRGSRYRIKRAMSSLELLKRHADCHG